MVPMNANESPGRAPLQLEVSAEEQEVLLFPLSHGQENIWLISRMFPDSPLFNLHNAFRLRMAVDPTVLERAINEVVRRHEVLRTTFRLVDDTPVQVVLPSLEVPLPFVHLTDDAGGKQTEDILLAEAITPFDLEHGPLIRTRLLRLGDVDFVLSLTMHHLVSDGWSLGIFLRELSIAWQTLLAGKRPQFPELAIQYGDYAAWQQESLTSKAIARQLEYWRAHLRGLPELDMPTDHPRPANATHAGGVVPMQLSPSLTQLATSFSAEEEATPFMILLSAFEVLLHRYSGQDDFAVGTYIAGRNRAELEPLIGFFINTLAVRVPLNGEPSFREVVGRARRVLLDAYDHQDVPFTKLVQELGVGRSLDRNPLVQVIFQVINVPTLAEGSTEASSAIDVDKGTAIFDLTLTLWPSGDGMRGNLEYNADLFEPATVQRFTSHYRALLEDALRHPDTPVGELRFLTEEELDLIENGFSSCEVADDDPRGLVELWCEQVDRHPQSTAFLCGIEALTYEELDRRAEALARPLLKIGATAGTVVGFCIERGLEVPVALLAILKTGAAFLPLDPTHPAERLALMVSDAEAKIVITTESLSTLFDGADAEVLLTGHGCEAGIDHADRLLPSAGPADPAYVIFTSGSTGRPKGATVPHRQVLNRLRWMWRTYPFGTNEVACQKTSSSFVDSIWEYLGGLLQGVPTVIVPDEVVRDPRALVDLLADRHVSRIWLVPSFLRVMLDTIDDLGDRLPDLRFWVTTGEPADGQLYERFRRAVPDAVLHNVYGTSEVWDATWWDPEREEAPGHRVPIGRPIDNVPVYVLDQRLQPVPIAVPGELCVGGLALADGYVGLPELTEQRFIPSPFSKVPGSRLYRTGDLARFRPDGCIEFLGRRDQQVKIRGFRVEPSEVESALARYPAVEAVAVTAYDSPEGKRLAAYVTGQGAVAPDTMKLRAHARQLLPDYMVPTEIVLMESLPLTSSGKIDRTALAAAPTTHRWATAAQAPRARFSGLEQQVFSVWQELLQRGDFGLRDNFFDLGGDSMLLLRVGVRLGQAFGQEVRTNDLFRYPTVESLAAHLGAHGSFGSLATNAGAGAVGVPQ